MHRYPATLSSAAAFFALTAFFWLTGTLFPGELPSYAHSSRQITGMALMLILLPTYIVGASVVMQRRSLALVEQLRALLPEPSAADAAIGEIRNGLALSWRWGCLVGIVMGLLNITPIHDFTQSATPSIDIPINLGQMLLWISIGLVGGIRTITARAFRRMGEIVEFDLFQLDRLRPLARSGLIDVVGIAAGMVLTPLQSLDAEFRWYNYHFPLLVLVPAGAFLLLWPLRSVHHRIRAAKRQQLSRIDSLVHDTRGARTRDDVLQLESLLAHRDRVHELRTWPLDTGILSRLAFYLVIPPLAWVGAALVELIVDRVLAG